MDDPFWNEVAQAIGEVCIWWADLEVIVHDIAQHLAIHIIDHETTKSFDTFNLVLSATDFRQKIAIVKLLAHHIESDRSPRFYDRVEELMNYLDNQARLERNRYIHDLWVKNREGVTRTTFSPRVRRPQSHKRVLELFLERPYSDLAAMREFAKNLKLACEDASDLDGHISDLWYATGQPEELVVQLPPAWQSLAHRDWLPPDKRGLQPEPSGG